MSLANAIIYGTQAEVVQLLQQGADVDEIDEYGFRPLIEAAICNKPEIAQLLLDRGAYIDQEDATRRTPLHWAVDNANLALSRLLLMHKADVNHYTSSGQSILTMPLLRQQATLKNLLYEYGADINFALDYINTKLLGHRFSLIGEADIVDSKGRFIAVSLEGFFLEVTLGIIRQSLSHYRNHFAARHLRQYFPFLRLITDAVDRAAHLLKYQHYLIKVKEYQQQIAALVNHELLIIPVAYRGHAITFIRFHDLWVKCDRGANSLKEGSVNIYRIQRPQALTAAFLQHILYERQSPDFIETGYKQYLHLRPVMTIPLSPQITGNCSWSNVEAAVPAILFLLLAQNTKNDSGALRQRMDEALSVYEQWVAWDKDRALYENLQNMEIASRPRQASKAGLLGAVLFQSCQYQRQEDLLRAEKILPILTQKDFQYVLQSYIDVYWRQHKTLPGKNFTEFLDLHGFVWQ